MTELVPVLCQRGLRVGTVKHSVHEHELDKPGKDSHRHRQAGGDPAGIITTGLAAVFIPLDEKQDGFSKLDPLYQGCDLMLIEGFKSGPYIKLEVFRREAGGEPLAAQDDTIRAVITDDAIAVAAPLVPRSSVEAVADLVVELLEGN